MKRSPGQRKNEFGQPGGNKPKPGGAGTGAWKKSETSRYQFEVIQSMQPSELEAYLLRDDLTSFQTVAARAVLNLLKNENVSIAQVQELIDTYESKPAQKVEMQELPTPTPLVHINGGKRVLGDDDTAQAR